MNALLQALALGLPQGALYGLMGFGLALIFRTTGTLNFSHGNAAAFGVLVSLSALEAGAGLALSIAAGIGTGFLLGVAIDRLLMRKLKEVSHGAMLIVTLGLLMCLEGLSLLGWGADFRTFPAMVSGMPLILRGENLRVVLPRNELLVIAVSLAVSLLFALFLKRSRLGLAIRARGQDELGARAVGISIGLVDSLAWGLGLSLAVLVGLLVAPRTNVHPAMLLNTQLYGITAAVLGGFGSAFGPIGGGLILGMLQALVGVWLAPDYQMSGVFLFIILGLVTRPQGLFGKREGRKA